MEELGILEMVRFIRKADDPDPTPDRRACACHAT